MPTQPSAKAIPFFQLLKGAQFFTRQSHPAAATPNTEAVFGEFYCQTGGSNLNAGSDTNNTATYTATNGNWSTTTNQYIPTDNSNPYDAGVRVGQYASIYIDGATVAVYIALVLNVVNAVNGAITVSSSRVAGAAPTTSATGRSIKIGGAWLGPNAASGFPFTLNSLGTAGDLLGHKVRVNMKNSAPFSVTAAVAFVGGGTPIIVQGYSSYPGDGGRATLDGGTDVATVISTVGNTGTMFADMIFTTSFATGTSDVVQPGTLSTWIRCVFMNARGTGIATQTGIALIECEAYNCNRSNTAAAGGFTLNGSSAYRCISHGNLGSNNCGFNIIAANSILQNCISTGNGKHGVSVTALSRNGTIYITNCDLYNNGGDGINIASGQVNPLWIENCNFIKNGGAGINNASAVSSQMTGYCYNNAYGAGSMSNGVGDVLGGLNQANRVSIGANLTPWSDPDNGDFSIVLGAALSAGRGYFTETQAYSKSTTGFPDVGAAQSSHLPFGGWAGSGVWPTGFVNHLYSATAVYTIALTATIVSGSLPPGLALTQPTGSSYQISGTPTTIGVYSFTIRHTQGTNFTDVTFTVEIDEDPDQGAGVVGGG